LVPPSEAQTPFEQVSPAAHGSDSQPDPSLGQRRASEALTHCFAFAVQAGPASAWVVPPSGIVALLLLLQPPVMAAAPSAAIATAMPTL